MSNQFYEKYIVKKTYILIGGLKVVIIWNPSKFLGLGRDLKDKKGGFGYVLLTLVCGSKI